MRPYLIRPPKVYQWLFPEATFRMQNNEKVVYLTFDDGPHPEATAYALDVLKKHDIKATFFVLGKNVEQHPELMSRIEIEGHSVGNHGMSHLNGWNTSVEDYLNDVEKGKSVCKSNLFRPAYGKLTYRQYKTLKETEQIILWDIISGDFDSVIDGEQVVANVVNNARNGSIIVMHDSAKAFNNLRLSLNEIIEQLGEKGYRFSTI